MTPQTSIPSAANVLGTIGTVLWCIQLIPQVWHNWKSKDTEGLPSLMVFFWSAAGVPLGVYAIVQNFNIPMQIQPQIFCALALVCWAQIFIYSNKWPSWKATLLGVGTAILFAGTEVLLVLTLRGPYARGVSWPITMVGIIAAIFIAAGLVPAYFELWKRKGRVIGINFVFLGIDWAGAFFSLMALVAQHSFDILGGVSYCGAIFLETGIFAAHAVWLYRTRRTRKEARLAGKTYDEYIFNDNKEMAAVHPASNSNENLASPKPDGSPTHLPQDSPC